MTAIPCKRPKVTVAPIYRGDGSFTPVSHDAGCHVPGCDWTYPADQRFMALRSDAEGQAAMHRQAHRAAVPTVLTKTLDSGRLVDQCQHCGWVTPEGFTTVDDRKRRIDGHLVEHHGLVSCS